MFSCGGKKDHKEETQNTAAISKYLKNNSTTTPEKRNQSNIISFFSKERNKSFLVLKKYS